MKRKAEEQDISLRASKKLRMETTSTDATTTPWDVWRAIEYFCDMNTLYQLTMTCKAFSSFFWDESYKKFYIWRWKHNFVFADEIEACYEFGDIDTLLQELTTESQKSIYDGSSNFIDPALLKTSTLWKTRYNQRLALLPNSLNLDRIYGSKDQANQSKIVIYDRTREQHEQEETRLGLIKQQEELMLQQNPTRGRRAQQPRDTDPFANLPKSLEFIFIGPSTAPVTIKTEISSENRHLWYFKASVWSYLTNTWCELFIHQHTGDESQEQFYPLCYPVISLLYGEKLDRDGEMSEYKCEDFRQLVVLASQMPHGAYTNTAMFVEREDESMENLFE